MERLDLAERRVRQSSLQNGQATFVPSVFCTTSDHLLGGSTSISQEGVERQSVESKADAFIVRLLDDALMN